jgi:ferredoxin
MAAPQTEHHDGRVDERDTMFARAARRPGTPAYEDYYGRLRPDLRRVDDRLRALPELCRPGGRHYEPRIAAETEGFFRRIGKIEPDLDLVDEWARRLRRSEDPTTTVRSMVRSFGAVAAGAAPVDPAFVYTVKGRFDRDYGQPVELAHRTAVVFLVEMDHDAMQRAPRAETIRESARQYWRAAKIAKAAATVLRAAGHEAKAHYDAHYDLILPPLAVRAGLGELGRNNILIADRFGSRVRIGAISTDLELRYPEPRSLGALAFCRICRKCAENCPSRALSTGRREVVRGVRKWPTNVERCYGYWRNVGTDCGICMAVCPFSHPDNAFHNLVRRLVRLHPAVARIALLLDDLVYGRRWRPTPSE